MIWSERPFIPVPCRAMKSAVVGDVWYLMGGSCCDEIDEFDDDDELDNDRYVPDVYSASLDSYTQLDRHKMIWKKLPSLNCTESCPINIKRFLLAVGGRENESKKPVSAIQRYDPETNTWEHAGELQQGRWNCTCCVYNEKFHVMGGNDESTKHKNTFMSSF